MTHLTRDNLNGIKYVAALHHDDDEIVTHRTCFAVLYGTVVQTAFGRRYIDPDTATIVDYTLLASIGRPNLLRAGSAWWDPVFFRTLCVPFSIREPPVSVYLIAAKIRPRLDTAGES